MKKPKKVRPKKPYRYIFAVPDIHGRLDLLLKVIAYLHSPEIQYNPKRDLLIFLGDYIDRGPRSKQVLERLISLTTRNPDSVICLRGNHENFPIEALITRPGWESKSLWSANGGDKTLDSYINVHTGTKIMSTKHLKWLVSLPYSHEAQGFFFSHAPVEPENRRRQLKAEPDEFSPGVTEDDPKREYSVHELTWTYFDYLLEQPNSMMAKHEGPLSNKGLGDEHLTGVCGHIHRLNQGVRTVRLFPKYRMLDSGCGCLQSAPLALHECISGKTVYFDTKSEDLSDFVQSVNKVKSS